MLQSMSVVNYPLLFNRRLWTVCICSQICALRILCSFDRRLTLDLFFIFRNSSSYFCSVNDTLKKLWNWSSTPTFWNFFANNVWLEAMVNWQNEIHSDSLLTVRNWFMLGNVGSIDARLIRSLTQQSEVSSSFISYVSPRILTMASGGHVHSVLHVSVFVLYQPKAVISSCHTVCFSSVLKCLLTGFTWWFL